MLLALVTGQRLGDICNLKFSDIWDDMLHITQEKTGSKLAIPLNLKCDALNITLREVISQCRMLLLVNIWSITVTLPLKQTEETRFLQIL